MGIPTAANWQRPAPAAPAGAGGWGLGGSKLKSTVAGAFPATKSGATRAGGSMSNPYGGAMAGAPAPAAPEAPKTGSESGPGILENWFNQRAGGTDPGWEYGMGRAEDGINRQFAARGGYNSSGATGALEDMYANATSQREGQLDTLAGAASGEHQGRLNSMFTQGQGLANGQAGTVNGNTALGAAGMTGASRDQIDLLLAKANVDQKTRQAELDAIFGVAKTGASAIGGAK